MANNYFNQRKFSVLGKKDKSRKGEWDKKILGLCEKINSSERYYTTSSCSGRVVLIKEKEKKSKNLFLKVYHDLVEFEDFMRDIGEIGKIEKGLVKFKQEPCILHVACRSFEDAVKLLKKAQESGWKKSGIISAEKNFIVELCSTEKLEFFIMDNGKVLVGNSYLELMLRKSNENLKKSWKKIDLLLGKL